MLKGGSKSFEVHCSFNAGHLKFWHVVPTPFKGGMASYVVCGGGGRLQIFLNPQYPHFLTQRRMFLQNDMVHGTILMYGTFPLRCVEGAETEST